MRHRTFGTAPIHRPGLGFLFGAGAVVTGTVAWLVVVAIRPSLGLIEAYLAFALITALATTGIAWANQRFRPGAVRDHGSMLPLLALTALTAFAGVGFSYLFALPALAAAIALWLGNYGIGKQTRFAVVAVVTLLLSVPAIDVFLQFASPRPGNPDSNMAAAIVVPLALALLAIGVLRGFWPESTGHSPSEG